MEASANPVAGSESECDASASKQITPSEKSYIVAVCLSGIFGVMGVHHFYLERHLAGVFDLGLFILAGVLYTIGFPLWGTLVLAIDWLHTIVVTIMLLTGSTKDGHGHLVCYPGQRLNQGNENV